MVRDKIRNTFPIKTTCPYELYLKQRCVKLQGISIEGNGGVTRLDGSGLKHIRPIFTNIGFDRKACGSCYYENERVKLYCSIIGPYSSKSSIGTSSSEGGFNLKIHLAPFCREGSRIDYDVKHADDTLSSRVKASIFPIIDRNSFSYSQIDIQIYIVYVKGGPIEFIDKSLTYMTHVLYVPCVNAVSMALASSFINIYHTMCGASFLVLKDSNTVVYEPTDHEIRSAIALKTNFSLIFASYYINKIDGSVVFTYIFQSGPCNLMLIQNDLIDYYERTVNFFRVRLSEYFESRKDTITL